MDNFLLFKFMMCNGGSMKGVIPTPRNLGMWAMCLGIPLSPQEALRKGNTCPQSGRCVHSSEWILPCSVHFPTCQTPCLFALGSAGLEKLHWSPYIKNRKVILLRLKPRAWNRNHPEGPYPTQVPESRQVNPKHLVFVGKETAPHNQNGFMPAL